MNLVRGVEVVMPTESRTDVMSILMYVLCAIGGILLFFIFFSFFSVVSAASF